MAALDKMLARKLMILGYVDLFCSLQVDAVLDYDVDYADKNLGDRLPTSFQPDILDDRFEDRGDLENSVDTAMDPTIPLHVEFYLTQVRLRSCLAVCKVQLLSLNLFLG